jgi:hypothetical protein
MENWVLTKYQETVDQNIQQLGPLEEDLLLLSGELSCEVKFAVIYRSE